MANLQVGVAGNGTVTVGAGASVHSPASNILTLGTNGDERIRINANGYISVNDTSSNARLIVKGDSDTSDADCQIRIYDTDTTAGSQIPSLSFWGGSTEIGRIRGTDTSGMRFYTANSGTLEDRMSITSGGRVLIGTANEPSNKNTVTPTLNVVGSGVSGAAQITRHTSVGGGGALLHLAGTRGSDVNSYTILQDGDGIGTLAFNAADGNEFVTAAEVKAQVDGGPGDNDMPGKLIFSTTANGASSPTERLIINSSGDVIIGSTSSTSILSGGPAPLQVKGSDAYTGMSIIRTASAGAQLQFAAGSNGDNVSDNDGLGYIKFFGYHTNGYDEYARIHAEVEGTPGDGDAPGALVFATTADAASSPTERMRITSGGYVTVASIPSFKVSIGTRSSIDSAQYIAEDNGWTLVTTRDGFNTGSHFNEADGKFTAPVAGLYHFGFSIMRNGSNPGGTANPDIRIKKNNGLMWARGYWAEYDTNYQTTQCHTLTTLAVNDYVQFHIGNTASVYDDDSYMYGFFVG